MCKGEPEDQCCKDKGMRMVTKRGDGVLIAGERIEEVDKFTYLGNIVSKKGGRTSKHALGRRGKHSRC